MVDDVQITVQFYIDDIIVSHKDQAALDNFLDKLRSESEQLDELIENRWLVHEYLSITNDYLIAGMVVFMMFDYIEDVIVKCAKDMKNSCSYYLGNNQLFKVIADSPRLTPENTDLFYYHFVRILSASKRAGLDIQVCVAYMCTRVKSPREQDYTKLGRVISYPKEIVHLPH